MHGPFFWFATVYAYILIALSTILLIQTLRHERDVYRRQSAVLLAAAGDPVAREYSLSV